MAKDINILIFGDSITWGANDYERGGWAQRLKNYLEEKENYEIAVYNLGISGNTTEDILNRFENETKMRMNAEEMQFLFAIGINDTQIINSELRIESTQFKENIEKLIKFARKHSSKISFVGLTPVDDGKTNPIPWSPTKSYKNEKVKDYDKVIASICEENSIFYINIFDLITKEELPDGLHPNSVGHQKIFEKVRDFLLEHKLI